MTFLKGVVDGFSYFSLIFRRPKNSWDWLFSGNFFFFIKTIYWNYSIFFTQKMDVFWKIPYKPLLECITWMCFWNTLWELLIESVTLVFSGTPSVSLFLRV